MRYLPFPQHHRQARVPEVTAQRSPVPASAAYAGEGVLADRQVPIGGHKPEIACFQDDAKGSRFYKTNPGSRFVPECGGLGCGKGVAPPPTPQVMLHA